MTLDLNSIDLNAMDSLNRFRALEHASFIVEAPAGAGKTELLTQRYLKLMATVNEPEAIIALTFTNKAAAEMRNRILLSLENAQNQTLETAAHKLKTRELANDALAQSNANAWDIINQPSRLRILTIDALCSSLTRQMPLLSKFGGQPAVSDDTDVHYTEAARRAIAHITHETVSTEIGADNTVSIALSYLDNNSEKLTELLAKMLARRDQWLPHAVDLHGKETEEVSENTTRALQHLIAESLQNVLSILSPRVQTLLMPIAKYAAGNLDENAEIAPLLNWQAHLTDAAECLQKWQALARFLVTDKKTFRVKPNVTNGFPPSDEGRSNVQIFQQIRDSLAPESSKIISGVLDLPALASIAENQVVIQALTRLLILAERHLWIVFQAAGEVDFAAIAQSAQLALENEQGATDLALKLDYKISHLLIDEFQDTSPVQTRLVEKLIEGWQPDDGRTLFCVGDPMQSIYRFRKADVSLFLQASEFGIGHLPLTRLQLSRNNRSHPAVVDWINHAFKQVFPVQDNINQGAISYRQFTATRPVVAGEGVTFHPLILEAAEDANSKADLKQVEANYVANLIVKLRSENDADNHIAVLVRSRSHLKELVSEIRRNHPNLKFQAVEIEHLNERQTVQDALSLVCALHHRADRTHWLNVLRAPWCGLTLADLYALAADNHRATIWQLMQDDARLSRLSADGQQRLAHVKNVLAAAFDGQGRMPLRRWVESTWLQLGGGKCLVDAGDNRDVQVFFDLVEKIGRSGHLDIAALQAGMEKLYAKPDIEADGSVQFLTIHKSKGLEFDAVILPALNRQPRNGDNELVLWQEVMVDNHLHLIAAPLKSKAISHKNSEASVYDFLKNLEKTRADNELVRLLYVAATRAHRQLHLIASVQANKDGEIKPTANSLLQTLWPAVEAAFNHAAVQKINENPAQALDISQFIPKLQRLQSAEFIDGVVNIPKLQDSAKANYFSQSADDLSVTQLDINESILSLDLHKDCGTLAHLYMELFAKMDLQVWTNQRLQQCQSAMQKWLIQQGHTAKDAEQGAVQVSAALNATLNSEAGQWVLQKHTDAASELSLSQTQEDNVKNHVIDRTFIEDGVRWIVDYKLTTIDEAQSSVADLTVMAELHRPQLERYAGLFANESLAIKRAVLFLSVGKLVEL